MLWLVGFQNDPATGWKDEWSGSVDHSKTFLLHQKEDVKIEIYLSSTDSSTPYAIIGYYHVDGTFQSAQMM